MVFDGRVGAFLDELSHLQRVSDPPFHHRDPFDRLLVAQALQEQLALISTDRVFTSHGVKRVW
ncbi:MAG: hypothetical protein KJ066_01260 [Acidobacteria bacterium]|nr:hypothetical protein [Acidobacteriota bacterium]